MTKVESLTPHADAVRRLNMNHPPAGTALQQAIIRVTRGFLLEAAALADAGQHDDDCLTLATSSAMSIIDSMAATAAFGKDDPENEQQRLVAMMLDSMQLALLGGRSAFNRTSAAVEGGGRTGRA